MNHGICYSAIRGICPNRKGGKNDMNYLLTPTEQILNHMRMELAELRKGRITSEDLEHLDQIERDIRLIENIARRSGDIMTFH